MSDSQKIQSPFYIVLLLILSGETIFILPFVLARIFRPTFLDVFQVNNLELGTCFSIYGIVAFFSYLFGGPLADRFKPRILIAIALFLTAIGGVYMATYPSYFMLQVLFGYWGFTTIFLFWAAMIKATRIWGGSNNQGKAFGFLDGGRGLVAAGMGSVGVIIFSFFIGVDLDAVSLQERKEAFKYVILFASAMVACVGFLVLLFLKLKSPAVTENENLKVTWSDFITVLKIPTVWWLMIIILCAYVAYKTTDVFSLYAKEVMLFDEVEAAKIGTLLLYLRPVVGVGIGLLVDRSRSSIFMIVSFLLMLLSALLFSFGVITSGEVVVFFISIIALAVVTYALRTLYFSALKEGFIPLALTGTAVGLVSIIGYTPDIFASPLMGYLLDNSPGIKGFQQVFLMLSFFAILGLVTSIIFYKITKTKPND